MENSLSEILNAIPPKPSRSKLDPYYELIRELRRRSRSYREIAKILDEHIGLRADHTTICDFVRIRARRAKTPRRVDQLHPKTPANGAAPPESEAEPPVILTTSSASDGTADTCARIEAL